MAGRKLITIWVLFILVFLGMELYQFLPEKDYRHFYPLDRSQDESLQWYAKDIAFRVFILAFTVWAFAREWHRDYATARIIFMFPLFWFLELVVYLLYHSHRGEINFIIYIPVFTYGTYLTLRTEIWQAAEWIYSKRKGNGNRTSGR